MKKKLFLGFIFSVFILLRTVSSAQIIEAGGFHSLAICSDSTVRSCGSNGYGQLGDSTTTNRLTPVQVNSVTGITAVEGGWEYSLFLKNNGTVWTCGRNNYGQLGDGTITDRWIPVQVSSLTGITAVVGGWYHSLFLKNDGTVWACGDNTYGQLGDSTTIQRNTPVQVNWITGITAVTCGFGHSIFLKNDSTVWASGYNQWGQLGDGTVTDRHTPVQVSGLTGITGIAAASAHSLFLKNDGTVWACGRNNHGQLGDGTTTDRLVPALVNSLTGITAVAAGAVYSLFLKNDGTVWACGTNGSGQLGDSTTTERLIPVQVNSVTGITTIAGGDLHSLFLKNDGTIWACGNNADGELGDSTTTERHTPVQVNGLCQIMTPHGFTNRILGRVYADVDNNCNFTVGDFALRNFIVEATPGPYYGLTNDNGNYVIYIDTGNYTVRNINQNNVWGSNCQTQYNLTVNTTPDIIANINFSDTAKYYCTKLWVDIGTTSLRANSTRAYTVAYCNLGTSVANNSFVNVIFDNCIVPTSSSIPWINTSGNNYRFNLGNLNPYQCGNFNITVSVCNAIGTTHCIAARIYPDVKCFPTDTAYDRRQVIMTSACLGNDSVQFVIKNINTFNITQTGFAKIFVNNFYTAQYPFTLNEGDSIIITYPSYSNTIRCELHFIPVYEVTEGTQLTVEGCGTGPPVLSMMQQLSQFDADWNYEMDCKTISAPLDPNEKLVEPIGVTAMHYISSTDELEYQINFQNTGTDTAFAVTIRDTISPYLSVPTCMTGTSSHPYEFNIYGSGIAEWIFPNINLPDSNVNEPASHGFVKFKIKQVANNPQGTVIHNSASIYFDFNAPVITNVTENIVYDTTLSIRNIKGDNSALIIFPNPTNSEVTLNFGKASYCTVKLFNTLGEILFQTTTSTEQMKIDVRDFPKGIYFVAVRDEKNNLVVRKVVKM